MNLFNSFFLQRAPQFAESKSYLSPNALDRSGC
uniref:Uncharacterized protein n=1 Tax=Musa acuminata subsp. malaccensis TaxID=214687 RepID=A0A804KED7_MUSAM